VRLLQKGEPVKVIFAVGDAVTITGAVAMQPVLSWYVMIAVPAAIPVTMPPGVTVATPEFDDVHGVDACGVPVPVNVIDDPTQTLLVPEIEHAGSLVISALEKVLTNCNAQTKKIMSKELWVFRIRRQSKLIFSSVSISWIIGLRCYYRQ
jgi:hypothetical protein